MPAKQILIVEDHPESADTLTAGLSTLGPVFNTRFVSSAEEALRAIEAQSFDLLIADVLLPGISGLELMARFRRRNQAARVILLSGVRDAEIRKQVARSGADAFFFKPVELADVLDAVERQLGLVKSALPSELTVIRNSAGPADNTSQLLAELRFNLQAHSAILISAEGHVLARAGVLPDSHVEPELVSQLLNIFQVSGRVSTLMNTSRDDLLTMRGKDYFLHMASAGAAHALVVATKPLSGARFAALAEAVQKAAAQISAAAGQPQPSPADDDHLADTDPLLERVLDLADTKPTSRRAAERYWKATELPPLPLAGAISYAQAARIGLAPSDES